MRNSISKSVVAIAAALTMSAAVMSPTAPASAGQWNGGGFGGGFHPGFGGIHGGRFFHHGFWNNGVWINGWWGPAVVAGYDAGCWNYQPVYDAWGRYLGQAYVNVCS